MSQLSSKNVPGVKIFDKYREFLGEALRMRGMSQRDLAEKMQIGESQVSRWMNSEGKPVKNTREKICNVMRLEFREEPGRFYLIDRDRALYDRFRAGEHPLEGVSEPTEPYGTPTKESLLRFLELIESVARIAQDSVRKL